MSFACRGTLVPAAVVRRSRLNRRISSSQCWTLSSSANRKHRSMASSTLEEYRPAPTSRADGNGSGL